MAIVLAAEIIFELTAVRRQVRYSHRTSPEVILTVPE
jgi:hypothetical protein